MNDKGILDKVKELFENAELHIHFKDNAVKESAVVDNSEESNKPSAESNDEPNDDSLSDSLSNFVEQLKELPKQLHDRRIKDIYTEDDHEFFVRLCVVRSVIEKHFSKDVANDVIGSIRQELANEENENFSSIFGK